MASSYTITNPNDLRLPVRGIITDALTGISYACTDRDRIPLGVPLCCTCDAMLVSSECADCTDVIAAESARVDREAA